MTVTDIEGKLIEALVTITNDNAYIVSLTGRTTKNLVPWDDLGRAVMPVIAYFVVSHVSRGGAGDNRDITVQFSVFAEGRGAAALTRAIVEVLETAFTQPLLVAAGVDGFVKPDSRVRRSGGDDPDGATNRRRADLDLTFWVTK